jgi:hypothetical protein
VPTPSSSPPNAPARVGLDWRDARHWSDRAGKCRHCGQETHLRDEDRKPSHKTCAEAARAREIADQVTAYSRTPRATELEASR